MSEKQEGTRLKFLHCADVHLDTPYAGLSPEKCDERRRGLRATFMRMMEYVRGSGVDYCLISGDLFDTEYATSSTADIIIRELRSCPDTKFIIAPGKHDYYENNPIYTSSRLPKNCHVFTKPTLDRFDFEDDRVTVYGWAFATPEFTENPFSDKHVDDVSKINVVCGYADLDGAIDSTNCPVSVADLKRFGADYYAFGGRHEGGDFTSLEDSMYSYAGALESTGFENPGIGGAKLVSVRYNGGELSIDAKTMTFASVEFKTEVIDITGIDNTNEIINRISRVVSEKKYGVETALRIVLTGYVDPRFIIPRGFGGDTFGLYYFNMKDKTLPLYGTEYLKRDMSVKGELFRNLLPMLSSENEEERLLGARAFREGLAALENREIDI